MSIAFVSVSMILFMMMPEALELSVLTVVSVQGCPISCMVVCIGTAFCIDEKSSKLCFHCGYDCSYECSTWHHSCVIKILHFLTLISVHWPCLLLLAQ